MIARTLKKSVITIASLLAFSSMNIYAKNDDFSRAQKELKIMSKIFETSLSDNKLANSDLFRSQQANGTYLAKQGAVFTFTFDKFDFATSNDWAEFGEGIGNLVGSIASEVGNALINEQDFETIDIDDYAKEIELEDKFEAYQQRLEKLEAMRHKNHEQRDEVRHLQREIRAIERQSSNENSKKNDKLKKELNAKITILNQKIAEYKKSMDEYRKIRDQKSEQYKLKKSQLIITTLCDYGSTLRSLKSDEYFTLIFKNYEKDNDQVYVFNAKDVKNCDSSKNLIKKAISYQM